MDEGKVSGRTVPKLYDILDANVSLQSVLGPLS